MKEYIKVLRPSHYIKNVLIFLPAFFSGSIYDIEIDVKLIISYVAFSLVCSFIYIINDCCDVENDRRNPKRNCRPIASGSINEKKALVYGGGLCVVSFLILWLIHINIKSFLCVIVYIVINLIYSVFGGKHIAVLDIVIPTMGYPIRLLFGSYISAIDVSDWLFMTIFCFSFYLIIEKREGEMTDCHISQEKKNKSDIFFRPVLTKYNISFLEGNKYTSMCLGIGFYSLWAMEKSPYLLWTIPYVLIICMKYNLIASAMGGDPVEVIISSKALKLMILFYVVFIYSVLY